MSPVQLTDSVSVSYSASLESGETFEKVPENKPIQLAIGSGRILKAVEACLFGMEPGESKTVQIQPEDAYGHHQKDLVHTLARSIFGGEIDPKPGMILSLAIEKDEIEQKVPATVMAVTSDSVTVDYNHPLAGKKVTYAIKLHDIH